MPELIAGELVAAAVVDARVWESQGDISPDGIYLTGQPGPALPFILFRAWKIPVGIVQEEVRLFGPSGRMIFRWGPEYRRMAGMFDLTTEVDRVPHAVFDESGTVRRLVRRSTGRCSARSRFRSTCRPNHHPSTRASRKG